jgi:hypothetical protein
LAEPPNGWIKNILRFRQFSMRGRPLKISAPMCGFLERPRSIEQAGNWAIPARPASSGMKQMKSLFATTLSLLALAAAVPAQASARTSISGSVPTFVLPGTFNDCPGCVEEFSRTVRDENYSNLSSFSVYAMADYGVLKASASVSGMNAWAARPRW